MYDGANNVLIKIRPGTADVPISVYVPPKRLLLFENALG